MGNSIRVGSGTKRIEVNDNGDVILLPLGDDGFTRNFYKLVEDFRHKADGLRSGGDNVLKSLDEMVAVNAWMKSEVEKLFGDGTCEKVFGPITPGTDYFLDFLYQLLPFFEQHAQERTARMNKYSAGRTGSV